MLGFAGWYNAQKVFTSFIFYFPFNNLLVLAPLVYFYFLSVTNAQFNIKQIQRVHFVLPVAYLLEKPLWVSHFIILLVLLASCVQPAYKRVVVVTVDVSAVPSVETVGIRGDGAPLSWYEDYPMQELVKDSLYRAVIVAETGYLYGECKFAVNGNLEVENKDNRRIYFAESDTTYYQAVYAKPD